MRRTSVETGISRRKFFGQSLTAATVFSIVPRHVLGGKGHTPPSEILTKAVIGVGGMGRRHLGYGGSKLLAVCDVDEKHLQRAVQRGGKDVKGYSDFRKVLDRPDIDIVHVPTPPHWHGLISIAAAEAGKDIWCEKPMTRTIDEGQKVVDAVQRNGRIFRLNTWFRFRGRFYGSGVEARTVKKVVDSGMLGWPLKATLSGVTGFTWKFNWSGQIGVKPQAVPEELDYDMWLGPAPYRPYFRHRTHRSFRGYWDYDGGGLGDMGQHYLDPIQYIMEKDNTSPVFVEADAPQQHPDAVGRWGRIVLKYADGCEIHLHGTDQDPDAALLEGPKGKIYKGFKSDIPDFQKKVNSLPEVEPQVTDFEDAVRNRKKFALNEENGHRSCTLINLSKIAVRTGRSLHFDQVKQRFINDVQANKLINQPMRAPWQI